MIEWQRVKELRHEIGAEAFDQVIVLFLAELDETEAQLQAATTAPELRHTLHTLKGIGLNLGFTEVAHLCQTLETRAEQGETDLPLARVSAVLAQSRAAFVKDLPALGSAE